MNNQRPLQKPVFRMAILRNKFTLKTAAFLLFVMSLLSSVSAQTSTTGQVSGNVADQSGAAVPDATVTITNTGTAEKRTVTTSSDGNYSIPNLAVGTYRLSVSKNGFKETAVAEVVVNVANVTRQDIALEIGQLSETVEITADAVQVQTQTGTVGEIVSGEQVRELPLNGRSFVQLTQLQPGVAPSTAQNNISKGLFGGIDFSVNGNSAQSNLFLTDGANNNDTGSNRTILLFPSIEAIAEFKSLRNSYGPEFGQAAGAVVSIVTRGGTNEFHGSLFYFGRNDALNARKFYAPTKDKLRRNDYGFSIGGPLPFLNFGEGGPATTSGKDRLFFFYSQEWNKEIRGETRFGSVPTLLERQGNFSQPRTLINPPPGQTRDCSLGGPVISQANLSPAGQALVRLFPLPNVAWTPNSGNCTNWSTSAASPINFREENARIDLNVNDNNKVFARYTRDDWSNPYPIQRSSLWGDDAYPAVESNWSQPSQQVALKLTTTLGQSAVNEVQFSYSANRINVIAGSGADINRAINTALPGFYPDAVKVNGIDRPHPVFWGGIAPYNYNGGQDLWAQLPFKNSLDIYSVRDDASKVIGNHTFKAGFLYDTAAKTEDSGPSNEAPQFWGASGGSGNYLADVLTRGTFFGFGETNTMPVGRTRYKNLEFYLGDTWKVRPNITLELGARYSLLFEPYDARNLISSFAPELYDRTKQPNDPCNGLVVPNGTNPCAGIRIASPTATDPNRTIAASTPGQFSNRALRKNNYKNLAPRLGFAWDVFSNGKTAIRGGFGQFYLRERVSPLVSSLTGNSPFAATIGGERTLDAGPDGRPITRGLSAASNGSPRFGLTTDAETPYSLQFNVSVGQQLFKDTVLEVGYIGNRARKQLTQSDINQVLQPNQVAAAFAADGNAVNAFRPYSNYGPIYIFERMGRADYNSLQVLFRTRFSRYSQLQAAYTFSKSEADFGLNDSSGGTSAFAVLDRNNRSLDFAESDINRPHIFVANLIFNLPRFNDSNAFVKNILGGWETASILQFSSGNTITPQINATGIRGAGLANAFQAGIAGTGTNVANLRPIRVDGQPCTIDGDDGQRFINPAAFTLVGYKIGQTIPKKSACLGAPTKNVDISLIRNFTPGWLKGTFLGEQAKLQFRLEFFNVFNTSQFLGIPSLFYGGDVVCGNAPCSPTNNTITGYFNGTSATTAVGTDFGKASATRNAREIQYALRLSF